MTDEEFARRVEAIHAEARLRVPEWEPWMTAKYGYGGVGVAWRRKLAAQARKEKRLEDPVKLKRYLRDRNRYLRRIGRPEETLDDLQSRGLDLSYTISLASLTTSIPRNINRAGADMRFAYADPPYPGQSADLYANHPDYEGEVDHGELIKRLCRDYPDGWALSTSPRALRMVLPLCPKDVWTAAWHKTNAPPIRTTGRYIWSWEPVIVWRGRQDPSGQRVRDCLACGQNYGFPGQKPPAFTRWVVELLGAEEGDSIDDLFRGSGAVSTVLAQIDSQPRLTVEQGTLDGEPVKRNRRYAGLPGSKSHRVM